MNLARIAHAPIAVDFGVTALKVLQVSTAEPPALVAASMLPTPDPLLYDPAKRFAFQLEQLPKVLKRSGFRGKRAVCVIPADRTFCKHLQLTRSDGVNLRDLIHSAVPAELGCPASALVLRHIEVKGVERPGQANRNEVICLATPREIVNRLMQAVRSARLESVGMHDEFTCMLNAFSGMGSEQPQTTLYLDIGWARTRVIIASGKELLFARCTEIGGRHLDEAVAHQLKYELPLARQERLAMEHLTPDGVEPSVTPAPEGAGMAMLNAAMRKADGEAKSGPAPAARRADLSEPLDILKDEIAACLRYFESLFPSRRVDRAVFLGGEARHRALCQHLAKALRVAGQVADPMARVARTGNEPTNGVDFHHPQPGWAIVLGACLSQTDL
ncbi:MAG: hypothetical protein KF866_12085 [Phycisphaeraceae bacterium]|nr:hypothetical protein [Phycisphaeraceae bacterium]